MESLVPSVAMNPGLTEFIRILFGPSSFARTRVRESTAALVAVYTPPLAELRRLAAEPMLMLS